MYFPAILSPKFGFSVGHRDICGKTECMHKSVESMYESVCRIVMSGRSPMCQAEEVRELYEGAGTLSELLDNVFYERMGMSCEELAETLQHVIINKSC